MLDLLNARSVWQVEPHYSVLRTAFAGQDALAQDDLVAEVVDKHPDFGMARTQRRRLASNGTAAPSKHLLNAHSVWQVHVLLSSHADRLKTC